MRVLCRICILLCLAALSSAAIAETFQNPSFVKTNGPYYQMLAADLTHSGRQDLVYWSQADVTGAWYEVLRNDGQRQFTHLGAVSLPNVGVSQAVAADFNEDGKTDLVILSWYQITGYTLWFLAGKGDGTFDAPVASRISDRGFPNFQTELRMFPGRLAGTGHIDLAVSSPFDGGASIEVLQGDGAGHFSLQTTLPNVPATLESVLDVNGDGLADLVTWNYGSAGGYASISIQIYLNQGGGQFTPITAFTNPPIGNITAGVRSAVFADMNGDAIPDLICHDMFFIYTALGRGDGTFQLASSTPFESEGFIIDVRDMDGDGNPDLILEEDWGISVLLQQTGFTYKALDQALTGYLNRHTFIADVDGDGKLDAVVSDRLPDSTFGAHLMWGLGDGKLDSPKGYRDPYFLVGAATGQFTLGAAPDIAAQAWIVPTPLTLQNNGDGTFHWLPDPNTNVPPPDTPAPYLYQFSLLSGDFNGDGKPDLMEFGDLSDFVVGDYGDSYRVQSLLGNGRGAFAAPQSLPGFPAGAASTTYTAGDLNGDGLADVAVSFAGEVDVLLAQKDGSWVVTQRLQAADYTNGTQALFGDWNGYGILDLAILHQPDPTAADLTTYFGKGNGTFTESQTLTLQNVNSFFPTAVADLDGDGITDLLFSTATALLPVYGKSDGTFEIGAQIAMPQMQSGVLLGAVQVADVNRDGIPDLVALISTGVIVRHGLGNRTWDVGDPYISGGTGGTPSAFWVQDLNQDGFPDIATLEDHSYAVGVLLNLPGTTDLLAALSVSPEPQPQGAGATLDFALTPAMSGVSAPAGTVQISVDGVSAGSGTLTNGKLHIPLQGADKLLTGRRWVVASYAGSSLFHAVRAGVWHRVIGAGPAASSTSLVAHPTTVPIGGSFTLTATVSGAGGSIPTGTVTFNSGGTSIGTATLDGAGHAGLTWSPVAGTYTLIAAYAGDANFTASSSDPVTVTVKLPATITTLSASATSLTFGQTLTLSAKVAAESGPNPQGSVTFLNGAAPMGASTLDSRGVAGITFTPDPGTYSFAASYPGSAVDSPSTSTIVKVTVAPSPTTTELSASPNPAPFGTTVTLTAKVNAKNASPVGEVSFLDGATVLATMPLNGGSATYSTSTLAVGTHTLTASYPGLSGYLASTSAPAQEIITAADFAFSASPDSRTLYTGESTSFTVNLKPGNGFNLSVALACSQLPANITCTFNPATLTPANATSKLVIHTSAPSRQAGASVRNGVGLTAMTGLILFFLPRRLRRRSVSLMLLALSCLAMTIGGCGGPGTLSGGTPTGTQSITITGTATNGAQSLTHTATVTLQVKSLF